MHFRPVLEQLDVVRRVEIKCERRAVSPLRLTFIIRHFRPILEQLDVVREVGTKASVARFLRDG